MKRVVVTGLGLVTPLGCGVAHVWTALLAGRSGVAALRGAGFEKIASRVAARVPRTTSSSSSSSSSSSAADAAEEVEAGAFDERRHVTASELRTMSPASVLALAAADEAVRDAFGDVFDALDADDDLRRSTGVAVGMGMADLEHIAAAALTLKEGGPGRIGPYFVPRILTNMAAGLIAMRHGLRGPNHSVSTACATGSHSIGDAFNLIRLGAAGAMVCGGSESCVTPLALAGFGRLRALSTRHNRQPAAASRPFDVDRDGFVIGEGAGMVVLEELERAVGRGARIYAEVLGYGLSADAAHLTAPSEDGRGAGDAMAAALRDAGLTPADVGYVNAHATSTPLGDVVEARAVGRLFRGHRPPLVGSMKGALGHGQGAAGAMEACLSVVALHQATIPPNVNLERADAAVTACGVRLCGAEPQPWPGGGGAGGAGRRVLLKNSFGFGGTNASLCLASYP